MGSTGSSDRSQVDGRGLQVTFGPQVRSDACDPGAREAEERKVVDEVTRIEPTTHGSAEFLKLALQTENFELAPRSLRSSKVKEEIV